MVGVMRERMEPVGFWQNTFECWLRRSSMRERGVLQHHGSMWEF